jgi:carbon-monoxide dehydrogenase large subunit
MSQQKQLYIGRSVTRLEDPPLVTGRGRFAGDIGFPHMLHMRIVRAASAHGRIRDIDVAAALALPGVVAVWTAADIADLPLIEFREGPIEALAPYRQPVLARTHVRYVGEPVAAVFAEDAYIAEDAADLVAIDVEDLPVLIEADAPVGEFDASRSTEPTIVRQGYGDVDAAFRSAYAVIALDLTVGRHSGVPLETRGAIGRYDAGRDVLEMHGAAKVPHKNREALARMFGRPLAGVHLYEGQTGGGFGIRGELYPEDVLVCAAAMRLDRPVKWIEDRREHLIAANHSRQQRHLLRAAIDQDGRILAIDDEFFHDQGAYLRTHGVRVPHMICGILPGPYRLPAYRAAARIRLTNKTPAATYRAPGRFETTFVRERLIDAIAERLGIDAIEVRRRNLITKAEMPYPRPLQALGEEIFYDSGDYAGLIDKTLAAIGWDKLQEDLKRRRAAGEMVGAGLSIFVEKGGLGPRDGVAISVDTTGTVEVVTGGSSIGQGFDTVIAQVCAEMLGVDYRRVRVVRGRTDRIAFGIGAHASRATVMTASATRVAALKVRDKALELASELLQTPVDTLDIVDGEVVRIGAAAGPSIGLGEIANHLSPTSKHLGSRDPGLSAEGWHHSEHQVYPYGVHVAVVKVDPDTGAVAIERYLASYDIGRAINPMLVEGQIVGGFAQGMGGALYEEFLYDANGEPLAVTFADYLIPTAHETPAVTVLLREDEPSPRNPLGIKSAGEAGVTGVGGAVASAIDQAIGMPGAVTRLPVTPQRLKALLRQRTLPVAAE